MQKLLFLVLFALLAGKQVFSATDDEVQLAYDEFENITSDLYYSLYARRNNYTEEFIVRLALERLDGKLALNSRLDEDIASINTIVARSDGDDNVNVTSCTEDIIENLKVLRNHVLSDLETCLLNVRYKTAFNKVSSKWNTLSNFVMNYLVCTRKAVLDCKGNEVCGDEIIKEIEQKKKDMPYTLNLYLQDLLNSLDSFPLRCKDQSVTEFDNRVSDTLELVSVCVDTILTSSAPTMCNPEETRISFDRLL